MSATRAALFEDSWSMDPAELDFSEFRNRHICRSTRLVWLTPMHQHGFVAETGFRTRSSRESTPYPNGEDADYGSWENALDVGRSLAIRQNAT